MKKLLVMFFSMLFMFYSVNFVLFAFDNNYGVGKETFTTEWQESKKEFYVDNEYEVTDLISNVGFGFGNFLNKYPWSMEYFKGHLYVGTCNISTTVVPSITEGGAEVWRLEDESAGKWVKVLDMEDNIKNRVHIGFREMRVYNNELYVGSFSLAQNAALWKSSDGLNWEKVKTFNATSIRGTIVYNIRIRLWYDS